MSFQSVVEFVVLILDGAGVAVIVIGALAATGFVIARLIKRSGPVYAQFRRELGRSILVGLEILVAADIIRTVAVTPTLESVAALAVIVLIRTVLSFSLELEITGRWPWQKRTPKSEESSPTVPVAEE